MGGSLYKTSPLAGGTTVLLTGRVEGREPPEPVAWAFTRPGGGRTFYTSLGHADDFELPDFQRLLLNGVYWAAGLLVPREVRTETPRAAYESHWNPMPVPSSWAAGSHGVLRGWGGTAWYRCLVKIPATWTGKEIGVELGRVEGTPEVFFNGRTANGAPQGYRIAPDQIEYGELNLLTVRLSAPEGGGLLGGPELSGGGERLPLTGRWQFRVGDDPGWSRLTLPAKFAASTDIIFETKHARRR